MTGSWVSAVNDIAVEYGVAGIARRGEELIVVDRDGDRWRVAPDGERVLLGGGLLAAQGEEEAT